MKKKTPAGLVAALAVAIFLLLPAFDTAVEARNPSCTQIGACYKGIWWPLMGCMCSWGCYEGWCQCEELPTRGTCWTSSYCDCIFAWG